MMLSFTGAFSVLRNKLQSRQLYKSQDQFQSKITFRKIICRTKYIITFLYQLSQKRSELQSSFRLKPDNGIYHAKM